MNDTPDQVTLSSRIDPDVLKPIQQQLSFAATDNDGSPETKSYIQVKYFSFFLLRISKVY